MSLPAKQANDSDRLYEYVINNIRQMIADGKLQASQKPSSERGLAKEFNINCVPAREAFKILEYMGVLDSNPGDDTYAKSASAQGLISKTDLSFDAMANIVRDPPELYAVLETFAAHHVVRRRTDEDIASIQKLLQDIRKVKKINDGTEESVQNPRKLSHDFHQALVRATHNAALSSIYEYLYELLDVSRQSTINNSGISYSSIVAHEILLSRVIEGDTEGVRQCMEEHMEDVCYSFKSATGADHPGQKAVLG